MFVLFLFWGFVGFGVSLLLQSCVSVLGVWFDCFIFGLFCWYFALFCLENSNLFVYFLCLYWVIAKIGAIFLDYFTFGCLIYCGNVAV
ncbi:hypothetical protein CEX98_14925 [Pseudoalteromonas piscicida]|uniref:Uncharacterized protein n=1 Tax=Pseudoalteromonas piscicida TaxID=43662 RepID=A0A2A5JN72_PSEO7|nr:hypothetical protein CEX98_14925 [Pseudoalteromonas piscicida]